MKRGKVLLRGLVGLVIVYIGVCAVIGAAYRKVLYPVPQRDDVVPSDAAKIEAHTRDGKIAYGLRFGDATAPLTLVFFHGNGELAGDSVDLARTLASHGWAVVLAEYRGYGMARASGPPSERGIYEDAEAIVTEAGGDRPVLVGFSLGTGVATEMAARGHGRALVLLAPYTSIPDVASRFASIFPMKLLIRDAFDTRSKAAAITLPVLVAHGDADEVVPFDMGETVAHAFPKGHFVAVSGGRHMDLFAKDDHLVQKIVDFVIDVAP